VTTRFSEIIVFEIVTICVKVLLQDSNSRATCSKGSVSIADNSEPKPLQYAHFHRPI